jgi:hypothetical protein
VERPQLAAGCGDFVDDESDELDEDESLEVEEVDEDESLEDEAPDVSLARLSVR